MSLELVPVDFEDACEFIAQHHRHHKPPQGWKFGVGVAADGKLCGVVTVGRPVARNLDDGWTLEVTRCCTDGTKNAASMLYAAALRSAASMGYRRVITYTLKEEEGSSLKAVKLRPLYDVRGRSWSCTSRPRIDKHPTTDKVLWEMKI